MSHIEKSGISLSCVGMHFVQKAVYAQKPEDAFEESTVAVGLVSMVRSINGCCPEGWFHHGDLGVLTEPRDDDKSRH